MKPVAPSITKIMPPGPTNTLLPAAVTVPPEASVALDDCSLEVARGQMVGFVGPNGAGKTTAMRSIFGLVVPEAGIVTWDGEDVGQDMRRRFGYMPEERGLYPRMRIADQIVYFGRLHGMARGAAVDAADRLLASFGLAGNPLS